MIDETPLVEPDQETSQDPDIIPIKDRRVYTQPYDLVVESLVSQINNKVIFLRPLSDRPFFQRRYVWTDLLASKLVESILLNVPIPPCYLSQNEEYELDVIDGQQRIYSIYRFINNQFALSELEVLNDLNGLRYHEIPQKLQRQFSTHTLRCILITNESHSEIKFDVFERLNTNTAPLNAQELRNCIYRSKFNEMLKDAVLYKPWLKILGKKEPDKRMRDEELVLRFFSFYIRGIDSYKTPQKHWLNDTAGLGRKYDEKYINELSDAWKKAVNVSLVWFKPQECFRRMAEGKARTTINRALFDLVMYSASRVEIEVARELRREIRSRIANLLLNDEEFNDLISRAIDHTKRTKRRFEIWNDKIQSLFA